MLFLQVKQIYDVMDFFYFHMEYSTLANKFNVNWFSSKYTLHTYLYFVLTPKITKATAFQRRPGIFGATCSANVYDRKQTMQMKLLTKHAEQVSGSSRPQVLEDTWQ